MVCAQRGGARLAPQCPPPPNRCGPHRAPGLRHHNFASTLPRGKSELAQQLIRTRLRRRTGSIRDATSSSRPKGRVFASKAGKALAALAVPELSTTTPMRLVPGRQLTYILLADPQRGMSFEPL
jgi:hypothetical protein